MLTLVTPQTQHIHYNALNESFRLRHRVLVCHEKWEGLEPIGDREIDQFDTEDAYYLLAHAEADGPVLGCVRFVPSERPTLSSETFPFLFEGGTPPRGSHLFDVSRFVVDPRARTIAHVSPITAELNCGWIEFGVFMGLEGLTAIVDYDHLRRYLAFGIAIKPLGLPKQVYKHQLIAVCIETSTENAQAMRECCGRATSILTPDQIEELKVHASIDQACAGAKALELEV